MFTFDEYQRRAAAFAAPLAAEVALGLSGEATELLEATLRLIVHAGKASEQVRKHLAQGHETNRDSVAKELGDVQWYASRLCDILHLSMGDVAQANIAKLTARYGSRFTAEASIHRDEPTIPAIPSTRRSGETRAVHEAEADFLGRRGDGTGTGGYLSDGVAHLSDLTGSRLGGVA